MSACKTKPKFDNWIPLSDPDIKIEYNYEYKLHVVYDVGRLFKDLEDFSTAVKNSQEKPVEITPEQDRYISNRSRCSDIDCIINLIRGYKSYPVYRNEKTVMSIDEGFKKNFPMKMPIVLKFEDGRMRVMSGNTRMDIAFINCINPRVIMLPVKSS